MLTAGSTPSRVADLGSYAELEKLPFLNSCIDEAVRLHTMLPGNTVLRKTKRDLQLGSHTVDAGSVLWLYPNAVHLDEEYFPEPKAFCPMRLLNGNLESMQSNFELVTFGHGQKRCIGEKMARAMILSFLAIALPALDADAPDDLPEDGFFDLIPASELRLNNVRARGASPPAATAGTGATQSANGRAAAPTESWFASAADQASEQAADVARDVAKAGRSLRWELWLAVWRSWTATGEWRQKAADALGWKDFCDGVFDLADRVSRIVQLERMLAVDAGADELEPPPDKRA